MRRRADIAPTADMDNECKVHGPHKGLICIECYSQQQLRVERDSAPLRAANTSEELRRRAIEMQAEENGHP